MQQHVVCLRVVAQEPGGSSCIPPSCGPEVRQLPDFTASLASTKKFGFDGKVLYLVLLEQIVVKFPVGNLRIKSHIQAKAPKLIAYDPPSAHEKLY